MSKPSKWAMEIAEEICNELPANYGWSRPRREDLHQRVALILDTKDRLINHECELTDKAWSEYANLKTEKDKRIAELEEEAKENLTSMREWRDEAGRQNAELALANEKLREALKAFKCPHCDSTHEEFAFRDGKDCFIPCSKCDGTGIHPKTREALSFSAPDALAEVREALEYYSRMTKEESSHLPPHHTFNMDVGQKARKALALLGEPRKEA